MDVILDYALSPSGGSGDEAAFLTPSRFEDRPKRKGASSDFRFRHTIGLLHVERIMWPETEKWDRIVTALLFKF